MRFACQQCQAKYSIPDARVAGKVVKLRCQRCGSAITIRGLSPTAAASEPVAADAAPSEAAPVFDAPQERLDADGFSDEGASTKIATLADLERIRKAAAPGKAPAAVKEPGGWFEVQWFVIVKGSQIGPLTTKEVSEKIGAQEFTSRTYAWREGLPDWQRLQTLMEFAPLFPEVAPPATMHPQAASEPRKLAALVDPKMAAKAASAPWTDGSGAASDRAAEPRELADMFTPGDTVQTSVGAPFPEGQRVSDVSPESALKPRESTRVFLAAAGIFVRKRRQRLAAVAAGVLFVALLTVIGLDLGGIIEIPALGLAYRAFGIENPHVADQEAQFASNLSDAERKKLRDGLMGKKPEAGKPASLPAALVVGKAPPAEDPFKGGDDAPKNDEQKLLTDLFQDGKKVEVKVEPLKFKTPEQDLPQGIGAAEITHVVETNQPAVRFCLERALKKGQQLSGKMEVEFTIVPSGFVSAVEIKTPKFKGTEVGACTTQAVKGWRFPRYTGEPISVEYPFLLSAGL